MVAVIRKSGNGMEKLKQNIRSLQDMKQASWAELFNPGFMRKHTEHQSMEDMFAASGYQIKSAEDFPAIPDDAWNSFVQNTTRFSSWEEMQRTAGLEFVSTKLHAGIK